MVFNLLNQNILRDVETPTEITEQEFWKQFFILQGLSKPVDLTNKEIEILSDVLSRNPDTNWFDYPYYEEVTNKYEMSTVYFKQIFYSLRRKGVIYTDDNKVTYFNKSLEQFQRKMKEYFREHSNKVYFFYPYKINNNATKDNEETTHDDQEE